MASPQWRDRLRQELDRQGLPSEYVFRLVEELSDHAMDILKENSSMDAENAETQGVDSARLDPQAWADARLGSPEALASLAGSEFQRRTFAGRHPLTTFLAGPVLAILGTLLAIFLTPFGVCWLIDWAIGGSVWANDELVLPPSVAEMRIMRGFNLIVRFAPFVSSACLFVWVGRRAGLRLWSVGACGITALIAVFFSSVVTVASADPRGMLIMGLGLKFGLDQVLQAAVPSALGLWLVWQHMANRSKAIAS